MFFFDSYAREYGVEEGGIVHHVAVPGVLAVGAVNEADPGNDDTESLSDQGPSLIYFPSFESRDKPDVVASDGVSVTGSGGFSSHFFGTSAAAPHVAGIAALLVEAQRLADPTMTKKQVADAVTQKIRDTAIDLGPSGHDNEFGYGRADALAAVESLDQLSGTVFTVDSTGDGADSSSSDGTCDDGNGNCTLRAAIQEANRVDGSFIEFDISGGGARTIQPASALPTISRTVFIDGFSQSGASASNYRIELDGTNARYQYQRPDNLGHRNVGARPRHQPVRWQRRRAAGFRREAGHRSKPHRRPTCQAPAIRATARPGCWFQAPTG